MRETKDEQHSHHDTKEIIQFVPQVGDQFAPHRYRRRYHKSNEKNKDASTIDGLFPDSTRAYINNEPNNLRTRGNEPREGEETEPYVQLEKLVLRLPFVSIPRQEPLQCGTG